MAEDEPILLGLCSDTHGGALPRWGGKALAAVLHGGDGYHAPSLVDDEPALRLRVEALGVPILAVRGNHDHRDSGEFFRVADDLSNARLRQLGPGLWVAGIGFAPKRCHDLPGESDLQPLCNDLLRQARRLVTPHDRLILLTHYSPKPPELPCSEVPAGWTYACIAELVDELRQTVRRIEINVTKNVTFCNIL